MGGNTTLIRMRTTRKRKRTGSPASDPSIPLYDTSEESVDTDDSVNPAMGPAIHVNKACLLVKNRSRKTFRTDEEKRQHIRHLIQLRDYRVKMRNQKDFDNGPVLPRRLRIKPRPCTLYPSFQETKKKSIDKGNAHCHCTLCYRNNKKSLLYRCRMFHCGFMCDDWLDFLEHQVDVHGTIQPLCRRTQQEIFQQERGVVPYPPFTVYIGQQVLFPALRPEKWTLGRLEVERDTLRNQLRDDTGIENDVRKGCRSSLWLSFQIAYEDVLRGGQAQLDEHLRLALEHYESALVYPIGPRSIHDSTVSIAIGRNWMLSPEAEHAEHLRLFRSTKDETFETEVEREV